MPTAGVQLLRCRTKGVATPFPELGPELLGVFGTLPPIIMEVENGPIIEETNLVGTHAPLP